ncbi:hypothetical protein [Azospirillum palustre]
MKHGKIARRHGRHARFAWNCRAFEVFRRLVHPFAPPSLGSSQCDNLQQKGEVFDVPFCVQPR